MKKKITGKDLTKRASAQSAHPRWRLSRFLAARSINAAHWWREILANITSIVRWITWSLVFKGVKGDDFKAQIEQGASDQEIVEWLNQAGEEKTPEEIKRWADEVEASSLYNRSEKQDFFSEEVRKLGLDPAKDDHV